MARLQVFIVCALGLAGCSEPFVTIPGGELSGAHQAPPAAWSEVPDTIQLETRLQDPYSINIWGLGLGPDLYVATGDDGTNWTEFIEQDSGVRVRIGGRLYRLEAKAVQDLEERSRVAQAYFDKYDVDPGDGWVATGMVFRLDRP